MTVDLRGAAYAASRISSTLKGSTKQFGWLQAPATNATIRLRAIGHLQQLSKTCPIRGTATQFPLARNDTSQVLCARFDDGWVSCTKWLPSTAPPDPSLPSSLGPSAPCLRLTFLFVRPEDRHACLPHLHPLNLTRISPRLLIYTQIHHTTRLPASAASRLRNRCCQRLKTGIDLFIRVKFFCCSQAPGAFMGR